jgi:hypothetical protein
MAVVSGVIRCERNLYSTCTSTRTLGQ